MKLNFKQYQDKVKACWIGKNIGGTIGTPYEGYRQVLDIKGFATAPNVVLPNDDLDLQLIWLYALERLGPYAINAATLGEMWLNYIPAPWNEYGIGKANMNRGLRPSLAGDYDNNWSHSNGAWIRTEIWACVAPAMPHIAAKFSIEDAKVDHGAGEGTIAAAFVAAVQSAAFVIPDLNTCIDIGLSAIPADSRMAQSIHLVRECYQNGKTWLEARNAVFEQNQDIGDGWFEAPTNVSYAVIGMLWGEGDFKKSMITAVNCGDDTDCTAATVGATMGILYGTAGIPKDWMEHIGDDIVTVSLSVGGFTRDYLPKTCTQLTERVVAVTPAVLIAHRAPTVTAKRARAFSEAVELAEENDVPADIAEKMKKHVAKQLLPSLQELKPYTMFFEEAFIRAHVTLSNAPEISANGEIGVNIKFDNNTRYGNSQYCLTMRWILPEGFTATGKTTALLQRTDAHSHADASASFVIKAGDRVNTENRMILEVTVPGRHTAMYISFLLFGC